MKGALKSLFKVPSSGKMSGASSGSGTAAWEDFSTFSNAPPLATGSSPSGLEAEEPHPLTKEWAERIGNRNVRAAFLEESIDGYTAAHDLRVWTGTWNTNGKAPPAGLDISPWLDVSARPTSSSSGSRRSSRSPRAKSSCRRTPPRRPSGRPSSSAP